MSIEFYDPKHVHLVGDSAARRLAPLVPRLTALLRLAGNSPRRCRPCRVRLSRSLLVFVRSTGTQVPVEP